MGPNSMHKDAYIARSSKTMKYLKQACCYDKSNVRPGAMPCVTYSVKLDLHSGIACSICTVRIVQKAQALQSVEGISSAMQITDLEEDFDLGSSLKRLALCVLSDRKLAASIRLPDIPVQLILIN